MKAMILAAGRGSRMGAVSNILPKPLTLVQGKPIIERNIELLKSCGINEIVINVSWLGEKIMQHLGTGSAFDVSIKYSNEKGNMMGTGGGVMKALEYLGHNDFWLINSDIVTDFRIDVSKELSKNDLCHLILVENPIFHKGGDFNIFADRVKYRNGRINYKYTFSGISLISHRLFEGRVKKKFALEPVLRVAAKEGKVSGEIFRGLWHDIGTPDRLNEANDLKI